VACRAQDLTVLRLAPEDCHALLLEAAPLRLAFDKHRDRPYAEWRDAVDRQLRSMVEIRPDPVDLDVRVDATDPGEVRFVFTAEAGADVPCHLLLPTDRPGPHPVVICLQGHTSGMHLSLGRARSAADVPMLEGGRDFAVQAVREGFAALVLEQRCFGERVDTRPPERHTFGDGCHHASMTALLLGRTMMGERCLDVSRAIDVLHSGVLAVDLDLDRIGCMGNSGGGAITLFAACLDDRIAAAMPSCYVCTFRSSIGSIDHCADNYVPGLLQWFEMGDLAALLAPRPLVVVAGRHDPLFPFSAVESTFARMTEVYEAAGASTVPTLVVGEGGHRFYPDQAWPAWRSVTRW
jgi:cephalosporin-C deacetylase-like acetyl esterase